MADTNNSKRDNKREKNKSMADMYWLSWRRRFAIRGIRGLRNILGNIVVILLILFLLSGGINQVKTGENLMEYAFKIGGKISNFLNSLINEDSPFKITDDGIYFDDADVPEDSPID